jgi:hypothetical protein
MFITGLAGNMHLVASGTIVKRWGDALNDWAGWLLRYNSQFMMCGMKGFPWNTTVIMRWSAVQDLLDGSPYDNHGVHIIRMCWGKVFDIDANEDSQLGRVGTCANDRPGTQGA